MTDITLEVQGRSYQGFTQIQISRNLHSLCGHFSLSFSPVWNQKPASWFLVPGHQCKVKLGSKSILTGYIDSILESVDPQSRRITITGRDLTCDLVDCHSRLKKRVWVMAPIQTIVGELIQPFGLEVESSSDFGVPITSFHIEMGETVFDAIARAARFRGCLTTTNGKGKIVLTRPKEQFPVCEFRQGENIMGISASLSCSSLYSNYRIQIPDFIEGKNELVLAETSDPMVKRFRPLTVSCEGYATPEVARQRLNWEVKNRRGKSQKVSLSTPGWESPIGPFEIGQTVRVVYPKLALNHNLLITQVTFLLHANSGRVTRLECEPEAAYRVDPTIEIKSQHLINLMHKEVQNGASLSNRSSPTPN